MDGINAQTNVVGDSAPKESPKAQTNTPNTVTDNQAEMSRVGKSVFYDCLELSPTAEKQDFMKPEQSDTDEESKFRNHHWKFRKLREKYSFSGRET